MSDTGAAVPAREGRRTTVLRYKAFVINLDRVPERYAFVREEADRAGIEITRWPAVDAARMTEADRQHCRPGAGTRWELPDTVLACFESHRRLWNHVVDEDLDLAVMFEDDFLLTREAGSFFAELYRRDPDFDVLKLDATSQKRRFGREYSLSEDFSLRPILQTMASAAAYVISREGARKLVAASQTYCDHLDDFVFMPRSDWTTLQLFPAIACQGMFLPEGALAEGMPQTVATSERIRDPVLNRLHRRPPLWFRLRRGLKREWAHVRWMLRGKRRLLAAGGVVEKVPLSSPISR